MQMFVPLVQMPVCKCICIQCKCVPRELDGGCSLHTANVADVRVNVCAKMCV